MPRRRLQTPSQTKQLWTSVAAQALRSAFGVSTPVATSALEIAHHMHRGRTGNLHMLGSSGLETPVIKRRAPVTSRNIISPTTRAMPYRSRKQYKRVRSTRARRRRLRAIPLGIEKSKLVRLRLTFSGSLSTGVNQGVLVMKANSLNDPTGTASAQLHHMVDQYAALYSKYVVLGSKLTMKYVPSTLSGPTCVIGMHISDSTTLLGWSQYREIGNTRYKLLTANKDVVTLTMKYSGKRFWKVQSLRDDSEQEGALSTTPGDPTDIAYYHAFVNDPVGAGATSVELYGELEFFVLLTNPIQVAQSSL